MSSSGLYSRISEAKRSIAKYTLPFILTASLSSGLYADGTPEPEPQAPPLQDVIPAPEAPPVPEQNQDVPKVHKRSLENIALTSQYPVISQDEFNATMAGIEIELANARNKEGVTRPYDQILDDLKLTQFRHLKTRFPFVQDEDIEAFYQYEVKSPAYIQRELTGFPTRNSVLCMDLGKLLRSTRVIQQYFPQLSGEDRARYEDGMLILRDHQASIQKRGDWFGDEETFNITKEQRDRYIDNIVKILVRAERYPQALYKGIDHNGWVKYNVQSGVRLTNKFDSDWNHSQYGTGLIFYFFETRHGRAKDAWTPDSYKFWADMHQRAGEMLDMMFNHRDTKKSLEGILDPDHTRFNKSGEYLKGFEAVRKRLDHLYQKKNSIMGHLESYILDMPLYTLKRAHQNLSDVIEHTAQGKFVDVVTDDAWRLLSNYFFFTGTYIPALQGDTTAMAYLALFGTGETSPKIAIKSLRQNIPHLFGKGDLKDKASTGMQVYFQGDYLIHGVPAIIGWMHDTWGR